MTTRLRPAASGPDGYRDLALRALVVLLVGLLAGAFVWSLGAERRAILRIPPVERHAIYENAYGEMTRLCGAGPRTDALEKRCTELIQFVVQFPECDDACQAVARSHRPIPTK